MSRFGSLEGRAHKNGNSIDGQWVRENEVREYKYSFKTPTKPLSGALDGLERLVKSALAQDIFNEIAIIEKLVKEYSSIATTLASIGKIDQESLVKIQTYCDDSLRLCKEKSLIINSDTKYKEYSVENLQSFLSQFESAHKEIEQIVAPYKNQVKEEENRLKASIKGTISDVESLVKEYSDTASKMATEGKINQEELTYIQDVCNKNLVSCQKRTTYLDQSKKFNIDTLQDYLNQFNNAKEKIEEIVSQYRVVQVVPEQAIEQNQVTSTSPNANNDDFDGFTSGTR